MTPQPKPRIGRPPRAASSADNRITIRLSDAEKSALAALAQSGETTSDTLRRLISEASAASKKHVKSRGLAKSA